MKWLEDWEVRVFGSLAQCRSISGVHGVLLDDGWGDDATASLSVGSKSKGGQASGDRRQGPEISRGVRLQWNS